MTLYVNTGKKKRSSKKKKSFQEKNATKEYVKDKIQQRSSKSQFKIDPNAGVSTSADGWVQDMTRIAAGDTAGTRSGNRIFATSLRVRGYITGADSSNLVRIVVARLKGGLASAVTTANFPFTTNSVTSPMQPWTHDLRSKWTVLLDTDFIISSGGDYARKFDFNIKINKQVLYGGPLIAEAQEGAIFMFAVSDSTAPTHPGVAYVGQLYYDE